MKRTLQTITRLTIAATLIAAIVSCSTASTKKQASQITVFAAASLTDVLSELVDSFEVKYQTKVTTNMASSGTLARQIVQGGNPDVYISASKKWANYVDSTGYILKGFKTPIAHNKLVLIAPTNSQLKVAAIDSSLQFLSLLGKDRLSIGDPAHVPAGKYAKQALSYYGWFGQLDKKLLPAKDVRSALMVVEMEEAPVGIVYQTDAQKSSKVKILATFPECSHKDIVYVAGLCHEKAEAKSFYTYINSDETKAIWAKYGFSK